MNNRGEVLLTNFDHVQDPVWIMVNDGIMGGLSSGRMEYLPDNQALFSGTVSLENNGGFASTRMKLKSGLPAYGKKIALRVKGDGKIYKFRIRVDNRLDGITYTADFMTKKDEWMEIELPFNDFKATYRGRILRQAGPLIPADIKQVGLLISEKQSGSFSLTLDWIKCR